jgi:hypothetical protein
LSLGTSQNNYFALLYTGIKDINAKTDFTYMPTSKHRIKTGFNYTYHTLYPAAVSAKIPRKGNNLHINKDSIDKRYSNEFAFYANDEWEAATVIRVNYGVRIPVFTASGKIYSFLEPRITTSFLINTSTSIKSSFTVMNQFVHLVPNSTASLPTDIWLSSSAIIKPQNSEQFAVGVFKNFDNNKIELSIEGYYKTMNNQVLFKEGTQIVLTTNLDSALTFGKGNSYGVEFFLRKNFGRISGWASYTWSKTTQKFEELNYGKPFPSSFDRRHNISLAGTYNLTKRWTISSDFVFYTGRPFTLPAGRVTVPLNATLYDGIYYDFSSRNNTRLKNYHRLDVSAAYKKERKIFRIKYESEWVFGAYNIYSRLNPYFVFLTTNLDTKQPEAKQVSLLPIVPSISFNAKF